MVCGNFFGESKKTRHSFHSSSYQDRVTRNKTSHLTSSLDEMDWGQSQISQAIRHLDFNLSTKWEQAFKLFADAQTDGVQRHLQAGFSNQEHIIRKILEDSAADRKITIQSPHPPEASDKSLLAGSQVQQVAAESDQHAEIEQLTLQLKTAEAELTAVKSQLEEAEIRTDQLRKLIIPTEPEPILDSKIQQLFSEIRTLTQRAVSKLYNKPPRYWDTSVDQSREFFKGIKDLPLDLQQDAIHSQLFICMKQWFFSNELKYCGLGDRMKNFRAFLAKQKRPLWKLLGLNILANVT